MPPHTATKRGPKKTDGPLLSGKKPSFRSPAKRKKKQSPRKRKKADTEYGHLDTDGDDDDGDDDVDGNESQPPSTPFVKVVGIDLGMWGHGKWFSFRLSGTKIVRSSSCVF